MTMRTPIKEGTIPFTIPSTGEVVQTWYRIAGVLPSASQPQSGDSGNGGVPLIALHGGPGCASDYMRPVEALVSSSTPAVITYDQIGNGRSTHLRERRGDESFWVEELFVAELTNLVSALALDVESGGGRYDLLGHSWGGCLAARFAARKPKGLRRLVLSNSPASMALWVEACGRLRREGLSEETQLVLQTHEDNGTTEDPEYEAAVGVFYAHFICRVDPWPETMIKGVVEATKDDDTVYFTMNGPNEFLVVGNLKNWSIAEDGDLKKIDAETLVINGDYDPAQDEAVKPLLDQIAQVKWVKLKTSHSPMADAPEEYVKVIAEFLRAP